MRSDLDRESLARRLAMEETGLLSPMRERYSPCMSKHGMLLCSVVCGVQLSLALLVLLACAWPAPARLGPS